MRGLEVGAVIGGMAAAAVASVRIAGEQAARERDQVYAYQTVEAWAAALAEEQAKSAQLTEELEAANDDIDDLEDDLADALDEITKLRDEVARLKRASLRVA